MAQTQLVKCYNCGHVLASVNVSTTKVRLITTKQTDEGLITDVEREPSFALNDGMAIICGKCNTENAVY
jgi:uncharacterized Zn finger protein